MQSNLHIPSTWFLVLFNVLLFHSLQFVPDVFGLLVMFGMELERYNFILYEHIHQWQDCCLLGDEYRPNGYSDGKLLELRSHRNVM